MSKIHHDQAPIKGITREDMLEDPCDLDLLSSFLYQVHERLSGGLLGQGCWDSLETRCAAEENYFPAVCRLVSNSSSWLLRSLSKSGDLLGDVLSVFC